MIIITLTTLGYGGIWAFMTGMAMCNIGIFSRFMMKTGICVAIFGFAFICVVAGMSSIIDPFNPLVTIHGDPSVMVVMLLSELLPA